MKLEPGKTVGRAVVLTVCDQLSAFYYWTLWINQLTASPLPMILVLTKISDLNQAIKIKKIMLF